MSLTTPCRPASFIRIGDYIVNADNINIIQIQPYEQLAFRVCYKVIVNLIKPEGKSFVAEDSLTEVQAQHRLTEIENAMRARGIA